MAKIYLLGLGSGGKEGITLGVLEILKKVKTLYLRTERHPAVSFLIDNKIEFTSFDFLYDKAEDFQAVYEEISEKVLEGALKKTEVAYALPGHPFAAEKSVEIIKEKAKKRGVEIEVRAGGSFMEAASQALDLDPSKGLTFLDALNIDKLIDFPLQDLIIVQVYNRQIASQVKLKLMDVYPDEHRVTIVKRAGVFGEEEIKEISLFELDREDVDHLTSLYVPPAKGNLSRLLKIMEILRGPDGCPWDREQDHRSLRQYVIEEAYEVVEAVDSGSAASLKDELGDLLLQVVFHAQIAKEEGIFNIFEVIDGVTEKIIRRHPHVFGDLKLTKVSEVNETWQEIKKKEGSASKCLVDTGRELPALLRAFKIQNWAARVGFDWPEVSGAWSKVEEELQELKSAYNTGVSEKIEEELGDLLFAIVNVARFLKINPDVALTGTNNKFCRRFSYIEEQVNKAGGDFSKFSLKELDKWWEQAKKINKDGKN